MLTYNRYINLLVFYHLCNGWKSNNIDYITSKYYLLFSHSPDKISIDDIYSNTVFKYELKEYQNIWNINLTDDDIKIIYYTYKINSYYTFNLKNLQFSFVLDCYNIFFKSYNTIVDKNMTVLLHDILKDDIRYYLNIKSNNEKIKNIFIRGKITKIKNKIS